MKVQKYLKYNKRGCFITSCPVSTVFIGSVSYQTVKPQWAANRERSHNCRRRKWTFSSVAPAAEEEQQEQVNSVTSTLELSVRLSSGCSLHSQLVMSAD